MSETEDQLIEKIVSHESDLVKIYEQIYPILKGIDRSELKSNGKEDVNASLEMLDRPEVIQPAKAGAILKAIMGSTSEDKFSLEDLFGIKMPDGRMLGEYVGEQLRQIGIRYHDFYPYLSKNGWLLEQ